MSVREALAIVTAALLAACDNASTRQEPSGPVGGAPVAENVANMAQPAPPRSGGELPPTNGSARFIGKWAANQKMCESAAWQFTQTTLHTPAGSVCSFDRVTEVPGGYDIRATCTAEAPPVSDTLKIRFAESAQAMLFESESIAGAGLVFCGRDS